MSPRPRFASLDPERRAAILQSAEREFARGYEAASTNRIIERAGVSKGAMYYYFDDKADLFLTTLEHAVSQATGAIGKVEPFADAEGFWEALAHLFERLVAFFASHPEAAGLLRTALASPPVPGLGRALMEPLEAARAAFHDLVERGVAVDAVRADLPVELLTDLAFAVGDVTDRYMLARWDSLGPDEIDAYAETALALQRRLLAPPDPGPAGAAPGRKP